MSHISLYHMNEWGDSGEHRWFCVSLSTRSSLTDPERVPLGKHRDLVWKSHTGLWKQRRNGRNVYQGMYESEVAEIWN